MLITTILLVAMIVSSSIAVKTLAGAADRSGRRVACIAFGWSDMRRHEDYGGPRRKPGDGGPGVATG